MAFFFGTKQPQEEEAKRGLLQEDSRSLLDEEQTLVLSKNHNEDDMGVRRFPRFLKRRHERSSSKSSALEEETKTMRPSHDPPFRTEWDTPARRSSSIQVLMGSHGADATNSPQRGAAVLDGRVNKTETSSTSSSSTTCLPRTPPSSSSCSLSPPTFAAFGQPPFSTTMEASNEFMGPDCVSLSLLLNNSNLTLYQQSDFPQPMVATSCRRHLRLVYGTAEQGLEVALSTTTNAPPTEEHIGNAIVANHLSEATNTIEAMISQQKASSRWRCLLVILYLANDQPSKALEQNIHHINDMAEIEDPTSAEGAMAVFLLLEHGLVQMGRGALEDAMAAWREAIHMSMGLHGYSTPVVALLLSYLGIGHFCRGNVNSGVRLMKESLELQKQLLSGGEAAVEDALYRLANAMGNLSVMMSASSNDQEHANSLLDEALTLYDSISFNVDEVSSLIRRKLETRAHDDKPHKMSRGVEKGVDKMQGNELLRVTSSQSGVTLNTLPTADMRLYEQLRLSRVFGSGDGLPSLASKLIDPSVLLCHDILMLGPLWPRQMTNSERVQETVLSWFDTRAPTSPNLRESIPVDVDNDNVFNANLYLPQIHLQTLKHLEQDEIPEAMELLESTLRSHQSKYGENHHLVGSALHNLGMVYLFADDFQKALEKFDDAFQIRSKILGPDHPDAYESLSKGALVHFAMGDLWKASDAFWAIYDSMKASGYPVVYKILNSIAITTYELGDTLNALQVFQAALEAQVFATRQKLTGKESLRLLEEGRAYLLENLAFISFDCGADDHALNYYNAAKEILEEGGGDLIRLNCIEENIEYINQARKTAQVKKPMDLLLLETLMSTWCQTII